MSFKDFFNQISTLFQKNQCRIFSKFRKSLNFDFLDFKIEIIGGPKNRLVHPELTACHFGRFPDLAPPPKYEKSPCLHQIAVVLKSESKWTPELGRLSPSTIQNSKKMCLLFCKSRTCHGRSAVHSHTHSWIPDLWQVFFFKVPDLSWQVSNGLAFEFLNKNDNIKFQQVSEALKTHFFTT